MADPAANGGGATPANFLSSVRSSGAVQPQPMGQPDPALALVPKPAEQVGLVPDANAEPQAEGEPGAPIDPWDEPLHGLTTKQVVEALKSGTLPPELAKALKRKLKMPVGRDPQSGQFRHEEVELTIDELERGNIMARDYTNGKRELASMRRQAQEAIEAPRRLFESWKADTAGTALENHLLEMGLGPHIEQILQRRAQEYVEDQRLSPEARHWKTEARKAEAERRRMQREQQQRPPQQPDNSQMHAQVETMAKNALSAVGVPYAPTSARYFGEALQAVWDDGMDLTPEMVQLAAESARQQLMADRAALAPAPAAGATPPPLQGRPAPGPAGKPTAPANGQRGTIKDFDRDMAALRQRR